MEKVYCINCMHCVNKTSSMEKCQHKDNIEQREGTLFYKALPEDKNKNHDCKDYQGTQDNAEEAMNGRT